MIARLKGLRELGRGGVVAVGWLSIVGFAALVGPWLPFDRGQNLRSIRQAPAWPHVLGTDSRGVDMAVRLIDGARVSVLVGLAAATIGLVLGTLIGLFAGYLRGRFDRFTVVGLDVFAAFPSFVAALVASLVWGQRLIGLIAVLGILTMPVFARVTRAATLPLAERDFIRAAHMLGARKTRVATRELLPNIAVPVMSYALLATGILMSVEGALSFFGAGVPEGFDSWGKLIAAGQERTDRSPHLVLVPTFAVIFTVLALNTVAERWQQKWLFGSAKIRPAASAGTDRKRAAAASAAEVQPKIPGARHDLTITNLTTVLATPFGLARTLDGITLTIRPGEVTAIVGESGSGKTMLARSIIGLLPAPLDPSSSGSITFAGVDLRTLNDAQLRQLRGRRIAMVFQDPMTSLDPVQRIGRQLMEPLRLHLGLDRQAAREQAIALLEQVGIADPERRLRSYPHELSGGLRQRVAIAIALSCDPDVLIADEPTSALDVTIQAQLLDLLDRLRDERRLAVVLITHDLGVVASRADQVAVMYGGRIVEQAATSDLFAAPNHPYTVALLDAVPRLAQPIHHRLAAIGGSPPSPLMPRTGCSFAMRCGRVSDRCVTDDPQLVAVRTGPVGSDPLVSDPAPDDLASVAVAPAHTAAVADHTVACWHPAAQPVSAG
jgi:peptide/nickel transport system permease protein